MNTAQLARRLKKHHEKTRSWRLTAAAFGMDKSTAYRIACDGYDPADPQWRRAHGLGPRACPTCRRKITTPRQRRYATLEQMPVNVLRWKLEHREEMR